jgi:hypothetical protein
MTSPRTLALARNLHGDEGSTEGGHPGFNG